MFQQTVRLDCKMDGFSFAGKVPILDGLTKGNANDDNQHLEVWY